MLRGCIRGNFGDIGPHHGEVRGKENPSSDGSRGYLGVTTSNCPTKLRSFLKVSYTIPY